MATIVVCEDDPSVQKLIAAALRGTPHAVRLAADGAEGLALIERERPDLVVTDLAMPGLDGYALLDALAARPALAGIPVVLLTASAQRSQREEARGRGFAEVLTKPFSPAELRMRLEEIIGG